MTEEKTATRRIPLTQGKFALVDEEDWERVSQYKWHAVFAMGRHWYAFRNHRVGGKWLCQPMHRFILNACATDPIVDHKNRDGLDNRKENLRLATHSQNVTNTKMSVKNTTGFRGVTLRRCTTTLPWEAKIKKDCKTRYLGVFATAIEAARAYDEAARRIHGEFAVLNFPKGDMNG